jgi:hypothetical protein
MSPTNFKSPLTLGQEIQARERKLNLHLFLGHRYEVAQL